MKMVNSTKIGLIVGLTIVFGILFQKSFKLQAENLSEIIFCENNSELEIIKAKEINSNSKHDTKYKVIVKELNCSEDKWLRNLHVLQVSQNHYETLKDSLIVFAVVD